MSADTQYSTLDLRQMDEAEARNTLTVVEFERWEQLQELREGAQETRERWAEEDEQVAELTVHADKDALGTNVDLYGNDVVVHIDQNDRKFRQAAERYETLTESIDPDELDTVPDDLLADIEDCVTTMLDQILVRWNGTAWNTLRRDQRETVLADAADKWGVDGLILSWVDIAAAIHEDREQKVAAIESFRGAERGGGR